MIVELVRFVHLALGGAAVFAGLWIASGPKGTVFHARQGRLFVRALWLDVLVTTPPLLWVGDLFLVLLGLSAAWLAWSGERDMHRHRNDLAVSEIDQRGVRVVAAGAVACAGAAAFQVNAVGLNHGSSVLLIGLVPLIGMVAWTEHNRLLLDKPDARVRQHIGALAGALGALGTSVALTVLGLLSSRGVVFDHAWAVWFTPPVAASVFAAVWITRVTQRDRRVPAVLRPRQDERG